MSEFPWHATNNLKQPALDLAGPVPSELDADGRVQAPRDRQERLRQRRYWFATSLIRSRATHSRRRWD
jgi:hypothetical protein